MPSQANAISDLERAEHSSAVLAKRVVGVDDSGNQVSLATSAKQDAAIAAIQSGAMTVTEALSETAYDIYAAPYSGVTNISNSFIVENLELNFSAEVSKTITITTSSGTVLQTIVSSHQNVFIPFGYSFAGNDNITVAITQTGSACTMDLKLRVRQGQGALGADPVLGAGSNKIGSVDVEFADSTILDASGRLRISDMKTLFDSKQISDNCPFLFDDSQTSGSGTTSTHSSYRASTTMAVSASTAGKRVRQSYMWMNYQPGKSQLIMATGVLKASGGGTGIKRGFGYFNDSNGLFLQDKNGTIQFVRRSNVSGTPTDYEYSQSSWNVDKMDGTGVSGFNLDFTKGQILVIDFQWLSLGRVRFGFKIGGRVYVAHTFEAVNNLDSAYMSTPNLPIRYFIENDGTGGAASLEHICSTVQSEGGQDNVGVLFHKETGLITTGTSASSQYILMAGKLKSTHFGTTVTIENFSSLITTNNDKGHYDFVIGGTPSSTLTFNAGVTNSAVDIALGNGSITLSGGHNIDGGFIVTSSPSITIIENAVHMGSYINGTPQTWYLTFTPLAGAVDIYGSVTWRELI